MTPVIELKKVSKQFKETVVLKNISLSMYEGECIALLGKNGAGKSTIINLILDLFYPTSGEVKLSYQKKDIGFLSQKSRFPDDVTIQEMLDFVASFSNRPLTNEEINHVLQFDSKKYKQLIDTCSGGEQRLFDMCLAILNRPKLLIVDEPTTGMDTSTRNHFWQIIQELKNSGTTILFTTHYVEEVDYCADRVILLDNGIIQADETPYHLRTLNKKKRITIEKSSYLQLEGKIKSLLKEKTIQFENKQDVVVLEFQNEQTSVVLKELLQIGLPFDNVEITNNSLLEMIFNNQFDEKEEE
ncbi:ABC transporter ATP-binding protein [Vagococcus sp.]|uniref:ABC transporter ATP-binding protein n=1 Tax=Vagococcus sp. TaxID=1933889 RepID=UPI002FCAEE7D